MILQRQLAFSSVLIISSTLPRPCFSYTSLMPMIWLRGPVSHYITFIGQIEGHNDLRRTLNETDIRVPVQPNAGSQIPKRFLYPQVEIDLNTFTPNPIPSLFTATPVNQ
jgi:hypothetical protein